MNNYKLQIKEITINCREGIIVCHCTTPAQTHFSRFNTDYDVILQENVDLNGNPAWTNDDLLQAISNKTNLSVEEIKFLEVVPSVMNNIPNEINS